LETSNGLHQASRNVDEIISLAQSSLSSPEIRSLSLAIEEIDRRLQNQVSQLAQDALALSVIGEGGKFLEIGGGDGYHLSNTFALWREFGWTGDICEPLPRYFSSIQLLTRNAPSVNVHKVAIYSSCGSVRLVDVGELSSLVGHLDQDDWAEARIEALNQNGPIVARAQCPTAFFIDRGWPDYDFVSIDVEGAETDILSFWPWAFCTPAVFCIENSGSSERISQLDALIIQHGYTRVFEEVSMWDSWYVWNGSRAAKFDSDNAPFPESCRCSPPDIPVLNC